MKKNILTILLFSGILSLIGCSEQTTNKSNSTELEMNWNNGEEWEEDIFDYEDTTTKEEDNFALEEEDDIKEELFDAIRENANGDSALAIEYIRYAAEDLEQEGFGYEDKLEQSFQDDINKLNQYANAISDEEINDPKQIDSYLLETEITVAYNYLKLAQLYLDEEEETDAEINLIYSIEKMSNASKLLKNQSKKSLLELIERGELILESDSNWQSSLQKLIKDVGNWLKLNKSKLTV